MTASAPPPSGTPPIAIVGVSALFASSPDAGTFWRHIVAGRDLITEVPASHWLTSDYYDPDPKATDKTYSNRGSFLASTAFDPVAFGIPPSALPATDTSQLLALVVAQQVLDDAFAARFAKMDRSRMSVILGVTACQELYLQASSRLQRPNWVKALRESGMPEAEVQAVCDQIAATYTPFQEATFPGALGNVVAGRIANRFDLRGTNCIVDAACASSLAALSMAVQELYLGDSDVVIAGGVDTFNDISMYVCFSKTPALSPSGDARPFAAAADGTVLGEGLAMFAMKRLADAERDGDQIYAVLKGIGSASDGRALSIYAPRSAGQAECLRRAYAKAGYGPETVELVEAHGTGTKAGDLAEFAGLEQAFRRADGDAKQWCALGSIKSQIGHTKAAAGAAGLFKAVMALHQQVLPPTIKVEQPNPKLAIANSPFYINTDARPWITARPRRASVSSFGFGGTNFHIALEEYRGPGKRAALVSTRDAELLLLSGSSREELLEKGPAAAVAAAQAFAYTARQLQEAASAHPERGFRLAIVATDAADFSAKWLQAAQHLMTAEQPQFKPSSGIFYGEGAAPGGLALVFPGQGSQYVGMGKDLAIGLPDVRKKWDEAAAAGIAVHTKVFPRPAFSSDERARQQAALTATDWAQPALAVSSLSYLGLLEKVGLKAQAVAGHSFGELTALHAAAAFDSQTLLHLAKRRGELMAAAALAAPGAMCAVASDLASLAPILQGTQDVYVANDNGPRQVVLAGSEAGMTRVEAALKAQRITAKRLHVGAAFHSPLVAAAAEPFQAELQATPMQPLKMPVYANTLGAPYDAAGIVSVLGEQMVRPVQFRGMLAAMHADGIHTFVEVGPGRVLTGLVGQNLAGLPHLAVALDDKCASGWTALWQGLGQLFAAGYQMNVAALAESPVRPAAAPQGKRFTIPVLGSNYGKPYPPVGGAAALPKPNGPRPVAAAGPLCDGRVDDHATGQVSANGHQSATSQQAQTRSPRAAAPAADAVTARAPAVKAPVATAVLTKSSSFMGARMDSEHTLDPFAMFQQTLAQSHLSYLQAVEQSLTQAHLAYLRSMDTALQTWCGIQPQLAVALQAAPSRAAAIAARPAPRPVAPRPAASVMPTASAATEPAGPVAPEAVRPSQAVANALAAAAASRAAAAVAPAPSAAARAGAVVAPSSVQAAPAAVKVAMPAMPEASAPRAVQGAQLDAIMLAVVAEKTGYPAEMLSVDMALEADLGVDSIKRVEILSALQEKVPALAGVDPSELAVLQTLGEIGALLNRSSAEKKSL